jgi:transposase-like protein
MECPTCESPNTRRDSKRKTTLGTKQRWYCKDCQKRFTENALPNIKGDENTVIVAIDLYLKGVSYRGVADSLKQFYGLQVSHITVMNWINRFMEQINLYVKTLQPEVGDLWHADEQFIKVKGKIQYIWNVLDADTRFLLASNASPKRTTKDARATFKLAKAFAGKKAQTVVTDGAFSYEKAVRKEFATYKNPKPHKRYVSLRNKECSNNKLERFHGTFRQRDKVMKGFEGKQNHYAENFQTYYNFIKHHMALDMTPAQKAGIQQKPEWKQLLLKAVQQ